MCEPTIFLLCYTCDKEKYLSVKMNLGVSAVAAHSHSCKQSQMVDAMYT